MSSTGCLLNSGATHDLVRAGKHRCQGQGERSLRSETWTLDQQMLKFVYATEVRFFEVYTENFMDGKEDKSKVLEKSDTGRKLYATIRRRKGKYWGNFMKLLRLECIVTTEKLNDKRSRGR
ncbi:hypothetical protein ElyMa_002691800 [Elysia marginata]|uniref:Uncharacterized protein n=1 Tax=Elysia marginata TaxID=1093978 RepID=A0AAV4HBQ7_9GAST|nr:hypothetical protein ElyMa_002691800 [Elysia marginata]